MKSIKALLAFVMACALALGLFSCAAEEEVKEQVQKTPLEVAQADPTAFLNALIALLPGAEGFVVETGYAMDDIEAGNGTVKAAKDLIKGYIIGVIKTSYTKEGGNFTVTQPESIISKKGPKPKQEDIKALCPALFNPLLEGDLLEPAAFNALMEGKIAANLKTLEEDIGKGFVENLRDEKGIRLKDENGEPVAAARASDAQKRIHAMGQLNEVLVPGGMLTPMKANDVLELRINERLVQLETDIANGLVSRLTDKDGKTLEDASGKAVPAKDATDAQKRAHVLGQMNESTVDEAAKLFQIDGKLNPAAAEKLITPADKAAILEQLAKAKDYLLIEDYTLEPMEFTLYAQANKVYVDANQAAALQIKEPAKAEDLLKELKLELKAKLTATGKGTGAFEGEGEFPITLTLKKTVVYKNIMWSLSE